MHEHVPRRHRRAGGGALNARARRRGRSPHRRPAGRGAGRRGLHRRSPPTAGRVARGDSEAFDAALLDLGMLADGLSIPAVERRHPPVVIDGARNRDERVEGIEAGADDYVSKPFRVEEVPGGCAPSSAGERLRQRADRGRQRPDAQHQHDAGHAARRAGRATPQEYRLVAFLAHCGGRVVSQMEIVEHPTRRTERILTRRSAGRTSASASAATSSGPAGASATFWAATRNEPALAAAAAVRRRGGVDRGGPCRRRSGDRLPLRPQRRTDRAGGDVLHAEPAGRAAGGKPAAAAVGPVARPALPDAAQRLYWQVTSRRPADDRSRSLWDHVLPLPGCGPAAGFSSPSPGPAGSPCRRCSSALATMPRRGRCW